MDFEGRMLGMDRFETGSLALLPGQRVRARIVGHHPWGISAKIIGYEHVGASIDMIELFGATLPRAEAEAMFPPVGAEIDAVVQQIRRWNPPAWARLSIRPEDLELFRWPCDFCREPVTLSPGAAASSWTYEATTDQAAIQSSPTGHASPTDCTQTPSGNERAHSSSERETAPRRYQMVTAKRRQALACPLRAQLGVKAGTWRALTDTGPGGG